MEKKNQQQHTNKREVQIYSKLRIQPTHIPFYKQCITRNMWEYQYWLSSLCTQLSKSRSLVVYLFIFYFVVAWRMVFNRVLWPFQFSWDVSFFFNVLFIDLSWKPNNLFQRCWIPVHKATNVFAILCRPGSSAVDFVFILYFILLIRWNVRDYAVWEIILHV